MASLMEEIADALARDVIRAAQELGDENLVTEIGRVIGASSTTTQEAFMTAVRVRLSEQRARQFLAERLGKAGPAETYLTGAAPARRPAGGLAEPPAVFAPAPAKARAEASPDAAPRVSAPEAAPAAKPRVETAQQEAAAVTSLPEASPVIPAGKATTEAREAAAMPAPEAVVPARGAAIVRPRMAAELEKPDKTPVDRSVASSGPQSLVAALTLATTLPRRAVPPAEPRPPAPARYDDIEIPDGDWG